MSLLSERITKENETFKRIGEDTLELRVHTLQGGVPRSVTLVDPDLSLNQIDIPGYYEYTPNNPDLPHDSGGGVIKSGLLVVYSLSQIDTIFQKVYGAGLEEGIYFRKRVDGIWGEWREIF